MKIGTLVKIGGSVAVLYDSDLLGVIIARTGTAEWLVSFPSLARQQIFDQQYLIRMG